jgi:hypothetical protein
MFCPSRIKGLKQVAQVPNQASVHQRAVLAQPLQPHLPADAIADPLKTSAQAVGDFRI